MATPELTPDPNEPAEKERRRKLFYVTLFLLFGLPLYIIVTAFIVGGLTAPVLGPDGEIVEAKPLHWFPEMLIYLVLGFVWAFPLKRWVLGIGKKSAT